MLARCVIACGFCGLGGGLRTGFGGSSGGFFPVSLLFCLPLCTTSLRRTGLGSAGLGGLLRTLNEAAVRRTVAPRCSVSLEEVVLGDVEACEMVRGDVEAFRVVRSEVVRRRGGSGGWSVERTAGCGGTAHSTGTAGVVGAEREQSGCAGGEAGSSGRVME